MDPNANLEQQLDLARGIIALIDEVGDDGLDPDARERIEDAANSLAELVTALHEWITNGGFLPAAWVPRRTNDLGDVSTYELFTAALERRPHHLSPLAWLAELHERPPEASAWMLRWLEEQRELEPLVPLDGGMAMKPVKP